MKIDAQTGQVTLANGFAFDASLTQTEFEKAGLHDPDLVYNSGTPWIYFPIGEGEINGHPFELTLCFYRDLLVSLSFFVNHYPPGVKSWDNFSFDVEEKMQLTHARLLREWLGEPHQVQRLPLSIEGHPALKEALHYEFEWGKVWCSHDERSGGTQAGVRYTKNDDWARDDYIKTRPQ